MSTELRFLSSLISKAQRRLADQADIVKRLPIGASSRQAVRECEVLGAASERLTILHAKRERLRADEKRLGNDREG